MATLGSKLRGSVVPAGGLSAGDVRGLFGLYAAHYDAADPERFRADLAEKDYVILLRDAESGLTRGFSTQKVLRRESGGRPVRALFSGDTIIDPSYWGEQELVKAWSRFAGRLLASDESPLWWLLISKGHRTYLYLPLFFGDYIPRHDAPPSQAGKRLLDMFASEKFGDAFDPAAGLLRFPESLGQLKPRLAEVPTGRQDDPRVRFFLKRNPGYARGEELVCLARISPENMRGAAGRALREGIAEGPLPEVRECLTF